MEDQTDEGDSDIKKNFMVHKIKSLLADKWDLECAADFKHVFRFLFFPMHCHLWPLDKSSSSRWTDGPRVNNVEPIMVVFEDKDEKDQLWSKLSMKIVDDIVKRRGSIAITNVTFLSVAVSRRDIEF